MSIQASVLNLLRDLQRKRNMSYLLIAHDLAVVRQIADDLAVMYLGTIVEQGSVDLIYGSPGAPVHDGPDVGGPDPGPVAGTPEEANSSEGRGSEPCRSTVWAAGSVRDVGRRTHAVARKCQRCI